MEYVRTDIMGMPIRLTFVEENAEVAKELFTFFNEVDEQFSTYKATSDVSKINTGSLNATECGARMREVLVYAELGNIKSKGFFSVTRPDGTFDPSGVVKGWALFKAKNLLHERGVQNFMLNAAGDIATSGLNREGKEWSVGIRNPFTKNEIIKVLYPHGHGVATSGTYERVSHIYNPFNANDSLADIVSMTVIAPCVLHADIYATAAFAMGSAGISFIESMYELEGYSIDRNGVATMTSGFAYYTQP